MRNPVDRSLCGEAHESDGSPIVRDAAARLPNGEGTRADICELLKDSQYLAEASDQQKTTKRRRKHASTSTRIGVFTQLEDASLHVPAWREKKKRRKGTGHVDRSDGARSGCREDALAWLDVSVREANICRRDPVERQRPRDLATTRLRPRRPADAEEPATPRLALLKQDPQHSHDAKSRPVAVREANICRRDPVERQRPRDLATTRLRPRRPADAEEPATPRLALLKQDPQHSHDAKSRPVA
ncbi:hypothetical protein HPB52_004608 [Rhipicephalus sanguineus]|uniref:Nuclear factor related to kappa-B-binding protein second winged helix domain-containing protein n=1 Tax=Rhipicephalus sanguineus TaxID=34632 RepID=A0A9D4PQ52_RHISA|nr:hypothetical protein HPB52_004608 [Rhipicephalus sanguineus]